MRGVWISVVISLCTASLLPSAFATTACYEIMPDGGENDLCGLASGNLTKTFQAFNQPIESVYPGFALVILWGGILGIIWFKTERLDILGIVGLMVSGTATIGSTTLSPQAVGIGMTLLLISLGILLFQVVRQRVSIFT
jgi:hypothetical protein